MKKKIVTSLLAIITPVIIQANGVSLYVPYAFEHSVNGTTYEDSYNIAGIYYPSKDYDYDYKLKSKVGNIGLAFSTNIGKDKVFAYTVALECKNPESKGSDDFLKRYDMLHTFEFGVLRTEVVRLWIGPRLNFARTRDRRDDYKRDGLEFGVAAVLGLNVNLGKYFAITSSLDYKKAWQFGDYESTISGSELSGTFHERHRGSTFRLGVAYKFAEEFQSLVY